MNVATICTGHPRTYKRCINNWKHGLKDKWNADLYFGFWNQDGRLKGKSINRYDDFDETIVPKEQIINDLCPTLTSEDKILYLDYEEHTKIVGEYIEKHSVHSRPHGRAERWHQWYLLKKTYELIKNSDIEYDVVIRFRPDTAWVGVPKLKNFDKIQVGSHGFRYPPDYYFYGPQHLMEQMCNLYDILPEILETHRNIDINTRVGLDEHDTLRFLYTTNRVPAEHNTENFVIIVRDNIYLELNDLSYFLNEDFAEEWKQKSEHGTILYRNLNWDKHDYLKELWNR